MPVISCRAALEPVVLRVVIRAARPEHIGELVQQHLVAAERRRSSALSLWFGLLSQPTCCAVSCIAYAFRAAGRAGSAPAVELRREIDCGPAATNFAPSGDVSNAAIFPIASCPAVM